MRAGSSYELHGAASGDCRRYSPISIQNFTMQCTSSIGRSSNRSRSWRNSYVRVVRCRAYLPGSAKRKFFQSEASKEVGDRSRRAHEKSFEVASTSLTVGGGVGGGQLTYHAGLAGTQKYPLGGCSHPGKISASDAAVGCLLCSQDGIA